LDSTVIILLAVIAAVIIILCVILVKVLKGIRKATHREQVVVKENDKVADRVISANSIEDRGGREKTEYIGTKPKAILKYRENEKLMEYEMCTDFINIGRSPNLCHLVISGDNFLGNFHAIIFNKKNRFYVVDVNSKNGTYIETIKIEGSAQIPGSCKMRLASTEIEFIVRS